MSAISIQGQIARFNKQRADLEKGRAKHLANAASFAKSASTKQQQAERTSAASSRRITEKSALDERNRESKEILKAAALSSKIAELDRQLATKAQALRSALDGERSQDERRRSSEAARAGRETQKRRTDEKAHAREMGRLSRVEIRHVFMEAPKPEILRVLYLFANPDLDRPLRVDAEVSTVQRSIQSALHRELIELNIRPAATPGDLVDQVNYYRPHVVHFSGHGEAGLLVFDDGDVVSPAEVVVQFDHLAEILSSTDTPPRLLIMNSCNSLVGSSLLLEAVPLLIAMAELVGDAAATIFAANFYAAIANGQSVGHAFRQGKSAISRALMVDDGLPQLIHREDVDPERVYLIVPNASPEHDTDFGS